MRIVRVLLRDDFSITTLVWHHDAMVRTQVQLTQKQLKILRSKARRLNVSVAELVRRAVDSYVAAEIVPSLEERRRRALEAAGRFGSSKTDVGKRHDDYLADAYRE